MMKELIVDNFAGGGGASTGIEAALGRPIDIAINHDRIAIEVHKANHPTTHHECEDVFQIDPVKITKGRSVGLAWFSPDCCHFSKAKGGKPVSPRVRGLAWVVVRWAREVRPRVIILENVEEFKTWGPLTDDSKPCPKRKGETFFKWVGELVRYGYKVEWRELRACDYGAPTSRKRLFLIARRDGEPIVWPEPTHGDTPLKPYRSAASIIDWSIPCPSIFERKKPLVENTLRRIAKGIRRFVIETSEPFIVTYYGPKKEDDFRGQSLRDPLATQTTENRHALVVPLVTEHANASNPRSWDAREPLRTQCATPKGGHFALVAAFLAKHYGGVVGQSLVDPLPTATARATQLQVVTADLSRNGEHTAEVRAMLIKYYGNEKDGVSLNAPLPTVTTKDRLAVVTVMINGEPYAISDIGMRMLSPRELFAAQGFPEDYIIDPIVDGKHVNKTAQVRLCGNSVCPPIAEALVSANCESMIESLEVVNA